MSCTWLNKVFLSHWFVVCWSLQTHFHSTLLGPTSTSTQPATFLKVNKLNQSEAPCSSVTASGQDRPLNDDVEWDTDYQLGVIASLDGLPAFLPESLVQPSSPQLDPGYKVRCKPVLKWNDFQLLNMGGYIGDTFWLTFLSNYSLKGKFGGTTTSLMMFVKSLWCHIRWFGTWSCGEKYF